MSSFNGRSLWPASHLAQPVSELVSKKKKKKIGMWTVPEMNDIRGLSLVSIHTHPHAHKHMNTHKHIHTKKLIGVLIYKLLS